MEKTISLEEITTENIFELSEKDVSDLLNKVICDLPKDSRSYYVNIISSAFEFRSISAKKPLLKEELGMYGFKFYAIPCNKKLIMGVKRKALKKAVNCVS